MKAQIYFEGGVTIEVEAGDIVDLHSAVASVQEVFGENVCGLCNSRAIHKCRTVNGNDYHEAICTDAACGARLSFGQTKIGRQLFPIRELTAAGKPDRKNGQRGKHNGWTKYRGQAAEAEADTEGGSSAGRTSAEQPAARVAVAAGETSPPKTGAQLAARLLARQDQLVAAGRIKAGALLKFVREAGERAGIGSDIARWGTPAALALATEAAKEFQRRLPSPEKGNHFAKGNR